MGDYRISNSSEGVFVRQVAIVPLTLGCIATPGGCAALYFWSRDLQDTTGLGYWMPLLLCLVIIAMGLYLVLILPFFKEAFFYIESDRLKVSDRGLAKIKSRSLTHAGLNTLEVCTVDSDGGYWHTPAIELSNGEKMEIGFGCSTTDAARAVIDRIKTLASS